MKTAEEWANEILRGGYLSAVEAVKAIRKEQREACLHSVRKVWWYIDEDIEQAIINAGVGKDTTIALDVEDLNAGVEDV